MSDAQLFFVHPDGDDRHPGTRELPFATLTRAADAVRRLLAGGTATPVTVRLRGGTHRLAEPLVLTPADSGSPAAPVTYEAEPGEVPTLSGGVRITGPWRPVGGGILACAVPVPPGGLPEWTQLFLDGRRLTRARYPNGDPAAPEPGDCARLAGADDWPHREVRCDPAVLPQRRWAHPEEAVLHAFTRTRWGNVQWRLAGVDAERGALQLGEGGWQMASTFQGAAGGGVGADCPFYVENVFEELDSPGEWYLDRRAGLLYLLPPEGFDPERSLVEAAVLDGLIALRGSRQDPVRHLRFCGLRLAHTATTFLQAYEEPSLGDWSIHRGGAVFLEGVEDCAVEECLFDGVGGNAVFVSGYARHVRVGGNTFRHFGDSAICLVGHSHLRTDRSHACPFCGTSHPWDWDAPSPDHPAECVVESNRMHHGGVYGKQTAGVFLSLAQRITIAHNSIHHLPRAGICINDGVFGGHTIEWNDVHDTVLETGDHGPLNAWGRDRAWCRAQSHGGRSHPAGDVLSDARETTVIRRNRFRDRRGWGIDLDDGASNYRVTENLCLGVSVKLREGDHRTVENNIFLHPANPPGLHVGYEGNQDRFERNIVVTGAAHNRPEDDVDFAGHRTEAACYQVIHPPLHGPLAAAIDANLFWNDAGAFSASLHHRDGRNERLDLAAWQALGYDQRSIFADPLLRDPGSLDLAVHPQSPALALGFRPFDLQGVGPGPETRRWPGA